jgi:hypothetical protein
MALPISFPHKTVNYIACVSVGSRNLPLWIDAEGEGALEVARPRARRIERGDGSVAGPQEAMVNVMAIVVVSRDFSLRVAPKSILLTPTLQDSSPQSRPPCASAFPPAKRLQRVC